MSLITPIAHLEEIEIDQANDCLVRWGHKMGPFRRPNGHRWAHALFEQGQPVAVTVASALVNQTCAGLTRDQAVELARLCASRPGLCRVMLRLWREMILPALAVARGYRWAVSYQDEDLHNGATYRFDGWTNLARSHSGTDRRSGRPGRDKTIWGWRLPANLEPSA